MSFLDKLFHRGKGKAAPRPQPEPMPGFTDVDLTPQDENVLDDVSYIQAMKRIAFGMWTQYDVLLAARGYGWQDALSWADYMAGADIQVQTITVAGPGGASQADLIDAFDRETNRISIIPQLAREMNSLGVGGFSRALNSLVKIVWLNQTRILRLFVLASDEHLTDDLMKRYTETVIRRSFGTAHAMKAARPVPGK